MVLFLTSVLSIALAIILAVIAIWLWKKTANSFSWFKPKKTVKPVRKVVRKPKSEE
jgi:hypothetical protein